MAGPRAAALSPAPARRRATASSTARRTAGGMRSEAPDGAVRALSARMDMAIYLAACGSPEAASAVACRAGRSTIGALTRAASNPRATDIHHMAS